MAILKNGKMEQDGLQSAVFQLESGNLDEEFSDYRSSIENKGIKSNLSQITLIPYQKSLYQVNKLCIPADNIKKHQKALKAHDDLCVIYPVIRGRQHTAFIESVLP